MRLKKFLISSALESGQSILEYFILLTIIAAFTIVVSSSFLDRTKNSAEYFTNSAINKMNPDIDMAAWTNETTEEGNTPII